MQRVEVSGHGFRLSQNWFFYYLYDIIIMDTADFIYFGGYMELHVNNELQAFNYDTGATIGDIINSISAGLKSENRVICQISLDGNIIAEKEEGKFFAKKVSSINKIDLLVEKVEKVAINGLGSLEGLIPELVKVLGESADCFRTGETTRAQDLFNSSLDALEIVPTILDGVRVSMSLDFNRITFEGTSLLALENEMLKTMKAIFDVQENRDFVSLADLIEYELIQNLSTWFRVIPEIKKSCVERGDNK